MLLNSEISGNVDGSEVILSDIPDFSEVERLHSEIAPSKAAYDLIHGHCVVIATIAWQIAMNQNKLLCEKLCNDKHHDSNLSYCDSNLEYLSFMPKSYADRALMARSGMISLIGNKTLPNFVGGCAPSRYVDEYAVCIGALLHDIGTYKLLKEDGTSGTLRFDDPRYITHGLLGYNYLLKNSVSEDIAQFARNHTGVGLSREQVKSQNLPLPVDDYMPRTVEQEIVMVADKYNSKSVPPRFLTVESYRRKAARFGNANSLRWMSLVEKYGEPDVYALAEFFGLRVD